MSDFQQAQTNMVDCQISTTGVIDPAVLERFSTVPREKFVPAALQSVAYIDDNLDIGGNRYLVEPSVHARMLSALRLEESHVVLDLACATGYSSAILSALVSTVIAVDEGEDLLQHAEEVWKDLGVCNVVSEHMALIVGCEKNAPYDRIIVNGAVSKVPEVLLSQLADDGKLIAIVKEKGNTIGTVKLFDKHGSASSLFDACADYLPGFECDVPFTL